MSKSPRHRSPLRLELSVSQRRVLELLADTPGDDANLSERAAYILDWAKGLTGQQSAELRDASRRTISKWRCRFRKGGIAALSDLPRPGAPRALGDDMIAELDRLRQTPPPPGKSCWTTRLLAQQAGISQASVVRLEQRRGRQRAAVDLVAITREHASSVGALAATRSPLEPSGSRSGPEKR